jgi:hypothetical protein
MSIDSNLGIWGNESCAQCGACCYDYNYNRLCRNQEIRDGKSYCKAHEDDDRKELCKTWFCGDLEDDVQYEEFTVKTRERFRQRLRDIATNILGTNPCLTSAPQQNH